MELWIIIDYIDQGNYELERETQEIKRKDGEDKKEIRMLQYSTIDAIQMG